MDYDGLLKWASESPIIKPTDSGETQATPTASPQSRDKLVCKALQIDVLGEEPDGSISIYSEFNRKEDRIRGSRDLDYSRLLQIGGEPIRRLVHNATGEVPGLYRAGEVREIICYLAGCERISAGSRSGPGVWSGKRRGGELDGTVVLVGHGEGAIWNGELAKITHPRCGGLKLKISEGIRWYDFDRLEADLKQCTSEWAEGVVNESINLLRRWRWKTPLAAEIITGLILATWVQSIWKWRPQVAITGPSKAGKSMLMDLVAGIFSALAIQSSRSTAAGIRQMVENSSRVILCDEFERSKERDQILQMLRASGRGDKILRGSTHQKAQEFSLHHIAWVAAIEVGLRRAPDRNRFILLELLLPEESKKGQLRLPDAAELADLGQRMLAVAVYHVLEAKSLAESLRTRSQPGIDDRVVESFSVPAAMLGRLAGLSGQPAVNLLINLLGGVDSEPGGEEARDEHDLVHAVLAAWLDTRGLGRQSVGQLIDVVMENDEKHGDEAESCLARAGIKLDRFGPADGVDGGADRDGEQCLVLGYEAIGEHLLKATAWGQQDLATILRRLPEAIHTRRRVGGVRIKVVLLPLNWVQEQFLRDGAESEGSNEF